MRAFRKTAVIFMIFFTLTACETTKQAIQRDEVKGGLIGGALGAGAGAIVGSQTGHTGAGIAIGAGVGALTGAVIGRAMQKQKEELQSAADKLNSQQTEIDTMKAQQASVKNEGNNIIMNLQGDAIFTSNSSTLEPGAVNSLKEIASVLKKYPDTKVMVKGFTDSQGADDYNNKLSETRANAVKNLFISEGVSDTRITAVGLGKSMPVATNDTPEGRQLNRRVEITVISAEENK